MLSRRSIFAALLLALLAGCATSSHPSAADEIGHHGVGDQDRFRMMRYELLDPRDAMTSRDDVLRLMGPPDAVATDGSATVHHWMAYQPEWLGLGGETEDRRPSLFGDSSRETVHWYFFLAEFDSAGRLRRHVIQSTKGSDWLPEQVLAAWTTRPATRPS